MHAKPRDARIDVEEVDHVVANIGLSAVPAARPKSTLPMLACGSASNGRRSLLFDHLVRQCNDGFRYRQSERLSGFQVEDEVKLGGLLNRKISRICALDNLVPRG